MHQQHPGLTATLCHIGASLVFAGLSVLSGHASAQANAQASAQTSAQAAPEKFQALQISRSGEGRPVLMIPGLNSPASVWTETCAQLQPGVRCLMVQLPGFAGSPALSKPEDFLQQMKGQLQALLQQEAPQGATVVGHSLGGVLGLMLAADKQGKTVKQLVVVDSLPFLPGIQNPAATVEQVKPMAEGMRQGMRNAPTEGLRAQLTPMMAGMTRQSERIEDLVQWGLNSDRHTTAQAMYELWTTDLRPLLPQIQVPTTVLGAWAAYERMGSTQASTRAIFERQYADLKGLNLQMSDKGYHFLMWDDPSLVVGAIKKALVAN